MKVRAKITAVVLFVALVPTGVVAWTTLRVHTDAYNAQRDELQLGAAQAGATLLRVALEGQERALRGVVQFSTDWPSLSLDEREGAEWLVYSQLEEVAAVGVFDGADHLLEPLAFIEPGGVEPEWRARTRLRPQEVLALFEALPLDDARRMGVAIASVVDQGGSELLPLVLATEPRPGAWVVAVLVALDPVCRELASHRPPNTRLAVFDPEGRPRCAAQAGEGASRIGYADVENVRQGMIEANERGVPTLAAVARISGWTVVVEQAEAQALATGRKILLQSLLWLALGVGGALFAGTYMARAITRPLAEIERAAHRLAGGDFDQALELNTDDELGEVALAFNAMSQEIRGWNAELLDRVEERTRELRAAQDQLVEARKRSAIASLTAGVSHEINNPLTSVLAFAQILLADARKTHTGARQIELLETLEHEAHRIRDIVQRMQALSEQRDGTRPVPVSMEAVISDVCETMEPQFCERSITLTRDAPAGPVEVLGNSQALEMVVRNLLENAALSVISGEGRVSVRVRSVDEEMVVVEVADNGKGIAAENLDRIFDPFFTTKDNWRGVGLGLSEAHRIVSDHHGTITVRSQVGVGTTFRVTLPLPHAKAHLV